MLNYKKSLKYLSYSFKAKAILENIGYPEYIKNKTALAQKYDGVRFKSGLTHILKFWDAILVYIFSAEANRRLLRQRFKEVRVLCEGEL